MFRYLRQHKDRIPFIGDILFSLLLMPTAFFYMNEWSLDPEKNGINVWFVVACSLMGVVQIFRGFRKRNTGKIELIYRLAFGVAMIAGSLLMSVLGFSGTGGVILAMIFWGLMLTGRIRSIQRNHKFRNILLNLVLIFLVVIYALAVFVLQDTSFLVIMALIPFFSLWSIMSMIFSRIKLDVLSEIIRKTYAGEIILGLLLTIFACSWMLMFVEDTPLSYGDALWYCFAIVTTIGFGDITATSAIGRLISVMLGIYGIVVVALITSIIVNFYGEMKTVPSEDDDPPEKADIPSGSVPAQLKEEGE